MGALPTTNGDATAHPTVAPVQGEAARDGVRPADGREVAIGVAARRPSDPSSSLASEATIEPEEERFEVDRRPVPATVAEEPGPAVEGHDDRVAKPAAHELTTDVAGQERYARRIPFRDL